MSLFVYDGEPGSRSWPDIFQRAVRPVRWQDEMRCVAEDTGDDIRDGILVAHSVAGTPLATETCEVVADWAQERNIWVVLVSGSGFSSENRGNERVYYRQKDVKRDTSDGVCDHSFGACFQRFWAGLDREDGAVCFESLEPTPWPEHLVAVYLAARAVEKKVDVLDRLLENPAWKAIFEAARGEFGAVIGKEALSEENAQAMANRIRGELERKVTELEYAGSA